MPNRVIIPGPRRPDPQRPPSIPTQRPASTTCTYGPCKGGQVPVRVEGAVEWDPCPQCRPRPRS
jgi:hypothetical protein